jgi:hypothetical protein
MAQILVRDVITKFNSTLFTFVIKCQNLTTYDFVYI